LSPFLQGVSQSVSRNGKPLPKEPTDILNHDEVMDLP
jgi:hypothetical protein